MRFSRLILYQVLNPLYFSYADLLQFFVCSFFPIQIFTWHSFFLTHFSTPLLFHISPCFSLDVTSTGISSLTSPPRQSEEPFPCLFISIILLVLSVFLAAMVRDSTTVAYIHEGLFPHVKEVSRRLCGADRMILQSYQNSNLLVLSWLLHSPGLLLFHYLEWTKVKRTFLLCKSSSFKEPTWKHLCLYRVGQALVMQPHPATEKTELAF